MEYKSLGELVKLSQGLAVNKGNSYLFSDSKSDDYPYPLLRIVDFGNNERDNFSKYVSKEVSPSVIIDEKDIVFTRVTFECFRGYRGVLHNNLFSVEIADDCITEDYLYTVLQSDFVKLQAQNLTSSSVVPDLNHEMFKSIRIPVPDKNFQKYISGIYLRIIDKIENNNKINTELEAMAKTIYDYWFLQFEFPNEEGKPYKSSGGAMVWNDELQREIPDGWEVKNLGQTFTTNRGISYNSKTIEGEGVPMINLASFSPDNSYKVDGIKMYSGEYTQDKVIAPYTLVMCNTQQTAIDFKKDIIGKAMLVPDIFDGQDIVTSHHINTINTLNGDFKYYLCQLFNSEYFHKYIAGHTNGTNILGLLFSGVEEYITEIPADGILKKYAGLSHNIQCKKNEIIKENQELLSLRDFLLPMLMNGQVTFRSGGEE